MFGSVNRVHSLYPAKPPRRNPRPWARLQLSPASQDQGSVCNTGLGHTGVPEALLSVVKATLDLQKALPAFTQPLREKASYSCFLSVGSAALSPALAGSFRRRRGSQG